MSDPNPPDDSNSYDPGDDSLQDTMFGGLLGGMDTEQRRRADQFWHMGWMSREGDVTPEERQAAREAYYDEVGIPPSLFKSMFDWDLWRSEMGYHKGDRGGRGGDEKPRNPKAPKTGGAGLFGSGGLFGNRELRDPYWGQSKRNEIERQKRLNRGESHE